jgi:hypothetical protein
MTSLDRRADVSHEEAAVPGTVRRWRAFSLLAGAFLISVIDLTIVNVAPTIGRKLRFPESDGDSGRPAGFPLIDRPFRAVTQPHEDQQCCPATRTP